MAGGGRALRSRWAMRGAVALVAVLMVAHAGHHTAAQELPLDGGATPLSFNPASDPLGDVDTYKMLQQADVEGQWSKDDGKNATEKMKELLTFNSITHVDIKLVGFDGDGNYGLKVDEADLLRYFETMLEEHEKEAGVLNAGKGNAHTLPIRRRFFFRVIKAKKSLTDDISGKIRSWLLTENAGGANGGAGLVPVGIVDEVIRKDYLDGDLSQTHTIYVLNPRRVLAPAPEQDGDEERDRVKKPRFKEGEEQGGGRPKERASMTYWYDPTDKERGYQNTASAKPPTCGTTMWAGTERYAWLDLTAGPILYGPHTSGEGLVSEFSVPRLDNFRIDGQEAEYEAGSHHHSFVQEFLAEVVATIGKTCDLLIEPSLHHFPVPIVENLRLHLVHVTNKPDVKTQFADNNGVIGGMPKVKAWDAIKSAFGQKGAIIAMKGQNIIYNRTVVQMNDCKLCLAAYAASLRSHTSTVLRGNLKTQVHEYVDSKELHANLLTFLNKEELGFAQTLGIYGWIPSNRLDENDAFRKHWTIPVFVFDLEETSLILLDRFHQSVSFPEMVISLQTKSGPATVDFSCNDEMVALDASDATRPTLAALLQTGWGVAPTHEHFSGKKDQSEINYMWSVSQTPFGPFSSSTRLSFPLIDAAKRNLVYTALNASIAQVSGMMEQFSHFGKNMEDVLLPGEYVHFVRRWNVLTFKIRRTSTYLSLLNFNTALFYARSLRHDVKAIRNAVLRAGQFVHTYVGCVHDEESSILKLLIYLFSGAALLIMAYVLVHHLLAYRKKANFKKKM